MILLKRTNTNNSDLSFSMDKYSRKANRKMVIIIDEWDAVFRERKEDIEGVAYKKHSCTIEEA